MEDPGFVKLPEQGTEPLPAAGRRTADEAQDRLARLDAPATERPRWWRDQLRRRMLATADAAVALGAGAALAVLGAGSPLWALVTVPLALAAAKMLGLYDLDHRAIRHGSADEAAQLFLLAAIVVVGGALAIPGEAGALALLVMLPAAWLALLAARSFARAWWRSFTPRERTLVVGEGPAAQAIHRKVELFTDMHLELCHEIHPAHVGPGDLAELSATLAEVDRVVLAWSEADPVLIERLLELCREQQVKLSVVSPFRGRARPAERVSSIADVPVLEYNTWDVPRSTLAIKRAFDIGVAGAGLVVLSPLLLAIALAIKLDDRGPVLFRQRRAGRRGRPFEMLKFRSMVVDAEERLGTLVRIDELKEPMFKVRQDPRVTRVGGFLRRYSLDELPQLWNVLRGEMSMVGPRPEELRLVERYRPEDRFRLELVPGITGPMQVFGRGELTFSERLAVELDYIENLSLGRDIGLLARTVSVVLRGRGAF